MDIIFFGTSEFAVPSLSSLYLENNINILAVITQSDKPAGRGKHLTKSPIKIAAERLNLPILQPENQTELRNILQSYQVDFFVVIAYGMILNKEIIKMPRICAINVHGSLLPKYRGASPIQESLLNGDSKTGISIIEIDEKMDHGKIFLIKKVAITEKDNLISLTSKLSKLSAEILPYILTDIATNKLKAIPQEENKASFCRKIKKTDGKINWNKSSQEILNMIRAYTPWPSAYTEIKSKKLKILEAETSNEKVPAGRFIVDGKTLKIGTKKGSLLPKKVQLEGKNAMDMASFINGNKTLF